MAVWCPLIGAPCNHGASSWPGCESNAECVELEARIARGDVRGCCGTFKGARHSPDCPTKRKPSKPGENGVPF